MISHFKIKQTISESTNISLHDHSELISRYILGFVTCDICDHFCMSLFSRFCHRSSSDVSLLHSWLTQQATHKDFASR